MKTLLAALLCLALFAGLTGVNAYAEDTAKKPAPLTDGKAAQLAVDYMLNRLAASMEFYKKASRDASSVDKAKFQQNIEAMRVMGKEISAAKLVDMKVIEAEQAKAAAAAKQSEQEGAAKSVAVKRTVARLTAVPADAGEFKVTIYLTSGQDVPVQVLADGSIKDDDDEGNEGPEGPEGPEGDEGDEADGD